jgi:hypothetical protein
LSSIHSFMEWMLDTFFSEIAYVKAGINMKKVFNGNSGLQLLLRKYRALFRIPENLYYYSKDDYRIAERKFLKYSLAERMV